MVLLILFTQLKSTTNENLIFFDSAFAVDSGTSAFGFIVLMDDIFSCGCRPQEDLRYAHPMRLKQGGSLCAEQGQRVGLL